MRFAFTLCLLVVACGGSESDSSDQSEEAVSASSVKERWCNSYKSEQYCPKSVCVWFEATTDGAKAHCGLPLDR